MKYCASPDSSGTNFGRLSPIIRPEPNTCRASAYPQLRREIRHYKRFKALIAQWVDLSIEQSRYMMKQQTRRP